MSQTQTATEVTYFPTSVREVLQVYDIHQTGGAAASSSETSGWSVDAEWPSQPHRQGWVSQYNRIPPYREPSRSHRYFSRPAGRDYGEASFIVMMFSGVYLVSAVSKTWRRTIGRWRQWPWGYAVGGNW